MCMQDYQIARRMQTDAFTIQTDANGFFTFRPRADRVRIMFLAPGVGLLAGFGQGTGYVPIAVMRPDSLPWQWLILDVLTVGSGIMGTITVTSGGSTNTVNVVEVTMPPDLDAATGKKTW